MPKMEHLSTEILQQTCGFLSRDDLSRFSLVSKKCWAASRLHVFRTVCVTFSSPTTLEASVERWNEVLKVSESFPYVRHVQVLAGNLYDLPRIAAHQHFVDCGDRPLDPWKFCAINQRDSELLTDDAQWQKLNDFIQRFPALQEITWGCAEQIPCCVLKYLHTSLPQCRLHMRNFSLRSLVQPPQIPIQINSHELEIVTSPCLYSIAMQYDYMDDSGYANYNESAIMDMAAGLAPNLREIRLLRERCGSTPWLVAGLRVPRHKWHRSLISADTAQRAALQCLDSVTSMSFNSLKTWSTVTDFSVLRSLKVHYYLTSSELRWLTDNCQFGSLDTLVISPDMDAGGTLEDLADATESFLLSLPPLRELKLTGTYQQRTVHLILDHSGNVLRKLHLPRVDDDDEPTSVPKPSSPGFANLDFLAAIQQKCPVLEDLSLCMLRSQGDAREVAIYRGLGAISSLRKIHLSIYCSQPLLWDEELVRAMNDSDSSTTPAGEDKANEIDDALMDLAMDDPLARSIFRTISAAKPTHAAPLECLTLRVDALKSHGGGLNSSSNLIHLLHYVGHSWICTGTLRDDRPHQCLLEEYDPEDKLDRDWMEESGELAEIVDVKFASALHRVWPDIPSENWKNEWHSFPLQV
jgi:hypothetical protein